MHKLLFINKILFVCLCSSAAFAEEVNIISSDGMQPGVNKALKSQSVTEQSITTKVETSGFCGKDYSQGKLSLDVVAEIGRHRPDIDRCCVCEL